MAIFKFWCFNFGTTLPSFFLGKCMTLSLKMIHPLFQFALLVIYPQSRIHLSNAVFTLCGIPFLSNPLNLLDWVQSAHFIVIQTNGD